MWFLVHLTFCGTAYRNKQKTRDSLTIFPPPHTTISSSYCVHKLMGGSMVNRRNVEIAIVEYLLQSENFVIQFLVSEQKTVSFSARSPSSYLFKKFISFFFSFLVLRS